MYMCMFVCYIKLLDLQSENKMNTPRRNEMFPMVDNKPNGAVYKTQEDYIANVLKFQSPTTLFLVGSSQSGKTTFAFRLLRNIDTMFTDPPSKIIYAYDVYQSLFDEMKLTLPNFTLHKGLPSEDDIHAWTADGRTRSTFSIG